MPGRTGGLAGVSKLGFMPRPPGHGPKYESRRQSIIDLAAELFARKGYAATSVTDICNAAGLAKGALYYYIQSKENLLVEIQARVLEPLLANARQIQELTEDPVVRLRLLSETMLASILSRLDHVWTYEHDYRHLTGENRSRFVRQRRELEKILRSLIVEAMDAGSFRRMDARLAVLQFLNLHNHTYLWARPNRWDPGHLSREYCATLFRGFAETDYDLRKLEDRVRRFHTANPEWPVTTPASS